MIYTMLFSAGFPATCLTMQTSRRPLSTSAARSTACSTASPIKLTCDSFARRQQKSSSTLALMQAVLVKSLTDEGIVSSSISSDCKAVPGIVSSVSLRLTRRTKELTWGRLAKPNSRGDPSCPSTTAEIVLSSWSNESEYINVVGSGSSHRSSEKPSESTAGTCTVVFRVKLLPPISNLQKNSNASKLPSLCTNASKVAPLITYADDCPTQLGLSTSSVTSRQGTRPSWNGAGDPMLRRTPPEVENMFTTTFSPFGPE
mmetsp:Transcript_947/g.1875  ORF Transcript_947/g.1875 Transcript_947/m.1875 type:complete len:258 (-) Transcript_947:1006-1779(-)